MLFSRPSSYAIRALTYLAMQPPGKLAGAREISEHERIPSPFLSKILLQLRRGRLLRSYKGVGGGYELAQPPNRINLLSVLGCIEGSPFGACILEDHECSAGCECPLHDSWGPVRDQLIGFLEVTTLEALVERRRLHPQDGADCGDRTAVARVMDQ